LRYSLLRRKSIDQILADVVPEGSGKVSLRRNLGVVDLTSLGIAAVIGAGIFSTIGTAAASGGPAVAVLFIFTAIACAFSAMCYARFASVIPISGSAYTYAYASFGELIAWIIGWDLIMEYAIGNIAVAISWSDYFSGLMGGLGIHIPEFLQVDYLTAARGYHAALAEMASGIPFDQLSQPLREAWLAWTNAPVAGGIRIIADVPAFAIVVFICTLVFIGIYETKVAGNTLVLIKISILLLVITVGSFYVNTENWSPFSPNGITGVLKGVSGVFFAYIGFDAISTTAEECRNPRRDLPRAIILALIITTILYVAIALVLTGMVPYRELAVGDPLAYAFEKLHLTKLSGLIGISAVIAMAGVLLVFQVGQPRIWMSMSRDGLLPPLFSRIHRRFRTPWFATLVAGTFVAIPSLFMNLTEVTDLCSIGTLFAFVLVSGGVLILDEQRKKEGTLPAPHEFRIPYLNSRYWLPLLWGLTGVALMLIYGAQSTEHRAQGAGFAGRSAAKAWLGAQGAELRAQGEGIWESLIVVDQIPMFIFVVVSVIVTWLAVRRRYSLIPVLGLLTNLYLMAQLGHTNWMRFLVWLLIGLTIYFLYGRRRSKQVNG